jgi:hypothetical protein
VVQDVHFVRVKIYPALDVSNESIVCKTIPQPGNNIIKLPCALVALAVFYVFI